MTKSKITLKYLGSKWIEEEADGQKCECCDDVNYLFPCHRLWVMVSHGMNFSTQAVVCNSCFEKLKEI